MKATIRYFLASIVLVLALSLLAYSFFGLAELNRLAMASNPGPIQEYSLVEPVWGMLSPPDGQVRPSDIAGSVQLFFLSTGILGFILLVTAGLIAFVRLSSKPAVQAD